MGLQDRDWYWTERIRKERENAAGPEAEPGSLADPFARARAPLSTSAPFGDERPPWSWRQLGLLTVLVAGLIWASFSIERAVTRRGETAAAADQAKQLHDDGASVEQAAEERRIQREALAAVREAERARAVAARAELEAAALEKAKQEARQAASWQQFYKPEPHCSASWTVDCANAYIRAKRKFAAQGQP